jgi:Cu/Ag efflux protein CusF
MRFGTILVSLLLGLGVACARQERAATQTASTAPTGTLSTAAETTGELIGTIVSRDPAKGEMTFDHQEIKGMMGAMTMGFEVRGADVNSLPPDGTRVRATAHEQDGRYWVTDVQKME